ncbi:hypothetical protein B0H10DRAFT_2081230 [Mycena sp. CBHHK59/15]|nr:hypothetical protein B0H10DRAFT_2081230 [Mycena sp. CBHHK59/15]
MNSDSLHQVLTLSGKAGLRHCSQIRDTQFLPAECFDYFHYTHTSPAWLFNIKNLNNYPPLIYLEDLSGDLIRSRLQLSMSEIMTLRDMTPYHYRFLDTVTDRTPSKDKYTEALYIPDLARYSHRLITIGTLFGSSRLRLKDPNNKLLRTEVRQSMEFSCPQLVDAADSVALSMSGTYLGAHVRVGDGYFRVNGEANLRQVWWKLVYEILQYDISEAINIERTFKVFPTVEGRAPSLATNASWQRSALVNFTSGNLRCRGHRHSLPQLDRLNSPLFISTDVKDPATDPSLSGFLRTFPCTFFLSDFTIQTQRLDNLQNGYDGIPIKPFLLPMLDAMVVGRAWRVAGTEGSTFSRFIQDVLWRRNQGLGIIERG